MAFDKSQLISPDQALVGRGKPISVEPQHFVNGHSIKSFPDKMARAVFGLGCFWGAERRFWQQRGVYSTAVGYSAGYTENPSYEEVCSGRTAHNEVVLVVFDPEIISYAELLALFWTSHDPTQGMAQGNDRGSQYRSGIYCFDDEQLQAAKQSRDKYQACLDVAGRSAITTEITLAGEFYYAETYHQQYLAKNPGGYCGLGGTGVKFI